MLRTVRVAVSVALRLLACLLGVPASSLFFVFDFAFFSRVFAGWIRAGGVAHHLGDLPFGCQVNKTKDTTIIHTRARDIFVFEYIAATVSGNDIRIRVKRRLSSLPRLVCGRVLGTSCVTIPPQQYSRQNVNAHLPL